jgi:hypothetical protein
MYHKLNIKIFWIFPIRSIDVSPNILTINSYFFLNSIKWLVFIMESYSIF